MEPLLSELNDLLVVTYQSVVKVEEVMLKNLSNSNLTITEMHMLECIGKDKENGLTVSDIAQHMAVSPPSATMSIKRLEKKGYVSKVRCPDDGRCVKVRLTREGQRAEIAHRYFHRQMMRSLAGTMDEGELHALLLGVRKLHTFLTAKIESAEQSATKANSEGSESD